MNYIVVDLEMNPTNKKLYKEKALGTETIEIGAVMLNEEYKEISSFRSYVKPMYNSVIEPKITRLTGITNDMVDNAPVFQEAFELFCKWCVESGDDVAVYAWSDSDYMQIMGEIKDKECELSASEEKICGIAWIDFQKQFDGRLGFERRVSLKMALDIAGIDFDGKEHDALDDARNTAELFHVMNNESLFAITLQKIAELMKPKPIGNSLGSMFDFSAFAVA